MRKIHKKENNFFLNRNGKLGESGSGWLELSSKTSKSGVSTHSQKSGGCQCVINSQEESKAVCHCHQAKLIKKKDRSDKTRTRSYSNSSNNSNKLSVEEHRPLGDYAMKMIDEELEESSDQSDKRRGLPEDFAKGESISDLSNGEKDFYNSWQVVHDRKERQNQKQTTKINLRDLTESDFLEMTEASN